MPKCTICFDSCSLLRVIFVAFLKAGKLSFGRLPVLEFDREQSFLALYLLQDVWPMSEVSFKRK